MTRNLLNASDSSLRSCSIGWAFSCSIREKPFSVGLVEQPFQPSLNQVETVGKACMWLCYVIVARVRAIHRNLDVSIENG